MTGHDLTGEDSSFEVDDDVALVLDDDGGITNGPELVEVVSVTAAKHTTFGGPLDVRVYATCIVVRTGQRIPKVWLLTCGGCGRFPPLRCMKPKLKKAISGYLRRDAELALGRRLTLHERISFPKTFVGRFFRALIHPVRTDAEGNDLPEQSCYSSVGPFVSAEESPLSVKRESPLTEEDPLLKRRD